MLTGKCLVCKILVLIAILGACNWGLVGCLKLDLVAALLGPMSVASRFVYGVIGLSGLAGLAGFFVKCPKCTPK